MLEIIQNMYQFNNWANTRILDTAAQLTPEQLNAEANFSFGSIQATLVHILSAQWLWLMRWQGQSPSAMFDPHTLPDLNSIRTRWAQIERETQEFVSTRTEADLAANSSYRNFKNEAWAYPLWQQMLHQVNHATQHRSEIAMVTSTWGHSPGQMDFLYFVDLQHSSAG